MGKSSSPNLLQGTLDLLILHSLHRGPMHGYAIAQTIHVLSDEVLRVEEGSLYPALYRLELDGAISAKWGVSENNRKGKNNRPICLYLNFQRKRSIIKRIGRLLSAYLVQSVRAP